MIIRSKEFNSDAEKNESAKKSLEYAKKAIEADLKDPESWCNFLILNFFNLFEKIKN